MQALATETIPLKFKSYLSSKLTDRTGSCSIVARLALLYTVLSTVVLCAVGFFLYWTLVQSLRSEEQSILADKVAVLRQILRERPQDRNALEEEIEWESTARRQAVYYARPGPQRENHR